MAGIGSAPFRSCWAFPGFKTSWNFMPLRQEARLPQVGLTVWATWWLGDSGIGVLSGTAAGTATATAVLAGSAALYGIATGSGDAAGLLTGTGTGQLSGHATGYGTGAGSLTAFFVERPTTWTETAQPVRSPLPFVSAQRGECVSPLAFLAVRREESSSATSYSTFGLRGSGSAQFATENVFLPTLRSSGFPPFSPPPRLQ